jgi:Ca-activated chloride channel homolog
MTRRHACALLAGGIGIRRVSGQGSAPSPTRDSVSIFVTVRSKTGDVVRDLGIGDFTLEEAGVRQSIASLSPAADEPLTAGLLVDASASQMQSQERVRRASNTFLEKLLHAGDQALVVRFDSNLELIQDVTASRRGWAAALQMEPLHSQTLPRPSENVLLYDAVVLASEEYVRRWRPGRRVCVVLSDGVDSSSEASLPTAIEAAQRADVSIYTIFFSDLRSRTADARSRVSDYSAKILQRMARETGGDFFEARTQTIEDIYGQIETELRAAYRLSYTPTLAREGLHAIRVGVRRGDLVVLSSSGHFGGVALPRGMSLSRLSPTIASVGDVVTASGNDLGNSKVKAVYLTDGKNTFETQTLEQTGNAIKFKVPEETQPGPWVAGETRPHFWNLMLRTTDGELLYVGLKLGIQ